MLLRAETLKPVCVSDDLHPVSMVPRQRHVSSAPAPGAPVARSGEASALLSAYRHLSACTLCAEYVRTGSDSEPQGGDGSLAVSAVLSFHESGHRRDPRTLAPEHFGL